KDVEIEFIHVTHSTLQTVIVALHYGDDTVLYANDWKLDNDPVIGKTTNLHRLKKLGKNGVKLFVSDTVNISQLRKTFSEGVLKEMFNDVLLNVYNDNKAVFITTFASHLARISTILNFAKKMKRQPIILGRSMKNYISAGEETGLIDFSAAQIKGGYNESRSLLKEIAKNRGDYLVVTTGNQGEEGAMLSKIAEGMSLFKFKPGDQVVFSSRIIPHPINIAQRAKLENALVRQGARIFRDVHVSGHGSREDHRDLLSLLSPHNYVPCHTPIETRASAASLVQETGYELGKTVYLIQDGQKVEIS
ncbi:MAG: MBL fold metallo-hydrolase RNA specificity domain-containing protein, partial [Candidatus Ranarchaeia archaeon]